MINLSIVIDDFSFYWGQKEPIKPDYQFGEGSERTSRIVCRPSDLKIGMRVKSTFRRIATDGESGIIHFGTKYMPE